MNETTVDPLEDVIRKAGEGWIIDWHAPKDEALPHLKEILRRADEWGRQRFQGDAPVLTPQTIVSEFAANPRKVIAFLQVIASAGTPQILVMVWRVLQGMSVAAVRMEYAEGEPFRLHVRLESPYGVSETYDSDDIDDAVILRHLGIMKMATEALSTAFTL